MVLRLYLRICAYVYCHSNEIENETYVLFHSRLCNNLLSKPFNEVSTKYNNFQGLDNHYIKYWFFSTTSIILFVQQPLHVFTIVCSLDQIIV